MLHRSRRALLVVLGAASVALAAQQRTVWDGVSRAEAERGKAVDQLFCASCHSEDLSGGGRYECVEAPHLKGLDNLDGRDLAGIFEWTKDHMPPGDPSA